GCNSGIVLGNPAAKSVVVRADNRTTRVIGGDAVAAQVDAKRAVVVNGVAFNVGASAFHAHSVPDIKSNEITCTRPTPDEGGTSDNDINPNPSHRSIRIDSMGLKPNSSSGIGADVVPFHYVVSLPGFKVHLSKRPSRNDVAFYD